MFVTQCHAMIVRKVTTIQRTLLYSLPCCLQCSMCTKELRELYTSSMWACSSNYCFHTSSKTEVLFVGNPEKGRRYSRSTVPCTATDSGRRHCCIPMDKVKKKKHAVYVFH